MRTVIKNCIIVTAKFSYKSNVVLDNGKIIAICDCLNEYICNNSVDVINAKEKYLLPGIIDPHTHFEMPIKGNMKSSDDFRSGTIAGACGGVTTIIDFKKQDHNLSLQEAIEEHLVIAKKSVIDYSFHLCITNPTVNTLNEINFIIKDYGITSFKVFMTYDGYRINDFDFIKIMENVNKYNNTIIQLHAESDFIVKYMNELFSKQGKLSPYYHFKSRPVIAEEEAIFRAIKVTELLNARLYIVHLSSGPGLKLIKNALKNNVQIYTETCPQYLLLNNDYYNKTDWNIAKFVISPPIRTLKDNNELWGGINDGIIDTIGSDHCPFNFYGMKDFYGKNDYKNIPNGMPGIETLLMLLHSEGVNNGKISINKLVDIMSTNVAKVFNLKNKGAIEVGKDADLVLFDSKQKFTITHEKLHMNVDYNPYEGLKIIGMPYIVFSRGNKVAQWNNNIGNVEFIGKNNCGVYIKRN